MISLSADRLTYSGLVQKPEVTVVAGGRTLTEGIDYTITYSDENSTDAGTYTLTVTAAGSYQGQISASYVIGKAANPMQVKGKKVKMKARAKGKKAGLKAGSKAAKKAKTTAKKRKFKRSRILKITGAEGKLTFAKVKVNKKKFAGKFRIKKKTGRLIVKKGLKKGIYKIRIRVRAAGNGNYEPAVKVVTCRVKVR